MLQKICLVLLILGGLNWGILAIAGFNCIGWLLGGSGTMLARAVFLLVGLAAIGAIPSLFSTPGERANTTPSPDPGPGPSDGR